MQRAAQLSELIVLLEEIITFKAPADQVFHKFTRARRFMGSGDRRQIGEWLYDILRHFGMLSFYAADPLQLALAYMKLKLKWSDEEIESYFQGSDYAPPVLPPHARKWLVNLQESPDVPESLQNECPPWLWSYFKDNQALLTTLREQAPCDVRANTLKTDRDALRHIFLDEGISSTLLPYPNGLRIETRHNLTQLACFHDGFFEIQDAGSQAVIELCDPKPAELVIDLCAGGGGKTLGIAAKMGNKGRIIACDIVPWKLTNAQKRFRRANVHNVRTQLLDADGHRKLKRQYGTADLVLVDAPCSGTGTWRRNPDLRWRFNEEDLQELIKLQQELLDVATKLVKPNGRIVYATCSMLRPENEDQIDSFLKTHLAFTKGDTLNLYPPQTDGFFAQVLIKHENKED